MESKGYYDSLTNQFFPKPHEKVYKKGKRYYEKGWVVGHYGNVFIKEIEPTKDGRRKALFQCGLCSNLFEARIDMISSNTIKSCGCRKHLSSSKNAKIIGQNNYGRYKKDISGNKYGELTALYPTEQRDFDGNILWFCKCSCGNTRVASYKSLETGHVKYCPQCQYRRKAEGHIGEKHGKLVIVSIEDTIRGSNGGLCCKAKCDCGNEITLPIGFILRENGQQSCGKCKISKGELKVKEILESMNVTFTQQESFNKAIITNKKGFCKVDFFIPNQRIAIEYNGQQHYQPVDIFGGEEGFQKTQNRYKLKKDYCSKHKIDLIEIPYWDYEILDQTYLEKKGVSSE